MIHSIGPNGKDERGHLRPEPLVERWARRRGCRRMGFNDLAGGLETRPTRLAMGNSRIDEVYDLCGWLDCPRTDED